MNLRPVAALNLPLHSDYDLVCGMSSQQVGDPVGGLAERVDLVDDHFDLAGSLLLSRRLCGSGEFLVHLVHVLGRVGHVVVEPPGQECEKGAGEEPCSDLDRDGGVAVGLGAPFELECGVM